MAKVIINTEYEVVIGLEVHAQLNTLSKAFCADSAAFGAPPNTQISPITLGHPGTLPRMNKKAVEYAIRMGFACHCDIVRENYFARKNYFYPDLPKGYQISQHTTPICKNGYVAVKTTAGQRNIRLNRIHMEEDAGKSLHDQHSQDTLVDYNRAGVTLIEIVSEPDIHTEEEAYVFLTELRKLVRYLDICDGNMEEGSMRCDVNISIRPKGSKHLGAKVEVKNMNSFRNVRRAIQFETQRQVKMARDDQQIVQETRSFDDVKGTTFSLRFKEEANDYRYFPDPDLTPFKLTDEYLNNIKKALPALSQELATKYIKLGLKEYDAHIITDDKATADYFENLIKYTSNYKAAANWLLGPIKSYLNNQGIDISKFSLKAKQLARLISLVDEGEVNFSIASSRILPEMIKQPEQSPKAIAETNNLLQESNMNNILPLIDEVLEKFPDKVKAYHKGKKGLIGLFVGEVMKLSRGKADPKVTNKLLQERLNNI